MKKLFVLVVAYCCCASLSAQNDSTNTKKNETVGFLWLDYQSSFAKEGTRFSQDPMSPSFFIWGSVSWNKWGVAATAARDNEGNLELSAGPMFNWSGPKGNTYYEMNVSAGAAIPKDRSEQTLFLSTGYLYMETISEERMARHKVTAILNASYYSSINEWWLQAWASYTPVKWAGVRFLAEKDGAVGLGPQCNIRIGKQGVLSGWFIAGFNKQRSAGLYYSVGL